MLDFVWQLTTGQVLLIGFFLMIATMLFPRLIRRKAQWRLTLKKSFGSASPLSESAPPKKMIPAHNGNAGEIDQLASKLMRYARANSMRLVYPGTVKHEGQTVDFAMLLVGKFGVLAIKTYGFGGDVKPTSSESEWQQTLNGTLRRFPSPINAMKENIRLLEQAFAANDIAPMHLETAVVFTHKPLTLTVPEQSGVFDRDSFLEFVYQSNFFCMDNGVDVRTVSEKLVQLVKAEPASAVDSVIQKL